VYITPHNDDAFLARGEYRVKMEAVLSCSLYQNFLGGGLACQ